MVVHACNPAQTDKRNTNSKPGWATSCKFQVYLSYLGKSISKRKGKEATTKMTKAASLLKDLRERGESVWLWLDTYTSWYMYGRLWKPILSFHPVDFGHQIQGRRASSQEPLLTKPPHWVSCTTWNHSSVNTISKHCQAAFFFADHFHGSLWTPAMFCKEMQITPVPVQIVGFVFFGLIYLDWLWRMKSFVKKKNCVKSFLTNQK